ncbi:hypothetical protein MJO28_001178 [Puccinia striiformis f. sp. tritici]|uniref:Uncharacterized protein n=1 Tax=Puccinia striiformis f. sp. tritici TaxID=168172 RepID=A0ACC0F113_9BASI|nr:hypothetical protein MJO28_001178 [Puccinia striiformis f. sp. tritici]
MLPKSAYSISHSIQTLINALPIHQRSLSNIIIPISQPASPKLPPQRVKMAQSSSNSIQYTQFPTYRRSILFRPTLTHSFTDSHLSHLRQAHDHGPFQGQSKRKPNLLHPSKLQRTPLKPCLSPQSPTPSSISRQSKIKSESRLRKNLSDLESRLDDLQCSRTSSIPPSPLSSVFSPYPSRRRSIATAPSPSSSSASNHARSIERNKKHPRIDNEILGIFLNNNGGYLDDSDDSADDDDQDDQEEAPPNQLARFAFSRPPLTPLIPQTDQQHNLSRSVTSTRNRIIKSHSIQRIVARDALNRRSLSINVS